MKGTLLSLALTFSPLCMSATELDSTAHGRWLEQLTKDAAQHQADSTQVVRLSEQMDALQTKVEYLSEGNDRAMTVAWTVIGLTIGIFAVLVTFNFLAGRNEGKARITAAIAELKKHVEETMDGRINGVMDENVTYLEKRDKHVELLARTTDIAIKRKEAGGHFEFITDDKFGKQLAWLKAVMEYERAFPMIGGINTESFEAMVLFLKSNPITLHNQKDLLAVLAGFTDAHATHIAAVKAAIQPTDAPFI